MRFNKPFYVIGCAAAISSYLLFYFQNKIIILVRSSDICDAHAYSIVQWIFPKIIFRRSLLNEINIQNYPNIHTMIILDIWVAFCCIFSLIYSISKLQSITERGLFDYIVTLREQERKDLSRASARFRIQSSMYFPIKMAMHGHAFVFICALGLVFVYSPAISDEGRLIFMSLLASHGTGALVYGIGSTIPAFCLFYSILSYRLLRAFSQGNIR